MRSGRNRLSAPWLAVTSLDPGSIEEPPVGSISVVTRTVLGEGGPAVEKLGGATLMSRGSPFQSKGKLKFVLPYSASTPLTVSSFVWPCTSQFQPSPLTSPASQKLSRT